MWMLLHVDDHTDGPPHSGRGNAMTGIVGNPGIRPVKEQVMAEPLRLSAVARRATSALRRGRAVLGACGYRGSVGVWKRLGERLGWEDGAGLGDIGRGHAVEFFPGAIEEGEKPPVGEPYSGAIIPIEPCCDFRHGRNLHIKYRGEWGERDDGHCWRPWAARWLTGCAKPIKIN